MYDYEEEQIEKLEEKNKELRELCERLLLEINNNKFRSRFDGGQDYCHFCQGTYDWNSEKYSCDQDCITLIKIPEE